MGSGGWILLKYTVCLWNSQGIKRNNNNKDIKSTPFFKCQGCIILSFKYKLAHFIYLPLRRSDHKDWPIPTYGCEDVDKAISLFNSMFFYVSMRFSIILSDVLIHHTALSMVLSSSSIYFVSSSQQHCDIETKRKKHYETNDEDIKCSRSWLDY